MSRIGNRSIEIPKGVTVSITPTAITAKGPKGSLTLTRHAAIDVKEEKGELIFSRKDNHKDVRAAHGLMRALTSNLVVGVTKGFERQLEINGVGYRAEVKGSLVVLTLGFSHPVEFKLPEGVSAKVDKNMLLPEDLPIARMLDGRAEHLALGPENMPAGDLLKELTEGPGIKMAIDPAIAKTPITLKFNDVHVGFAIRWVVRFAGGKIIVDRDGMKATKR
jgi:large subunit ribosomal protein L6